MSQVTFDTQEWDSLFRSIEKNATDPKPVLRLAFDTRGFRDVITHFQQETGPDGAWKRSKRAELQSGQTLQDTGRLRGGFLPGNIQNHGKNGVVFYNNVPYAVYHDEGRGNHKREFMWLSGEAQEDMLNIILDQIVK